MTLRINGSTSGYVEIDSPAVGGSNTIVLPSGNGSANQLLKNGGTAGTLEYATVTADGTALGSVASINNGPLAGMRNAIINGNFDIWQRGTSFTATEYGADRWRNARGGSTCTMSRQAFTLGQTDVPGEPQYFCRMAVTSVTGAGNFSILQQRIEGTRTFANQQVAISFWAKADASKNIAIEIEQFFGTGGSPSSSVAAIGVAKITLGTSWQKITVTATIPSISGKTLGTDVNDLFALNIWFDAGSTFNARTDTLGQQSGTFDIAQVQVEPGPIATTFERRPIGTELSLCQRYYEAGGFGSLSYWVGAATNGFTYQSNVRFMVTKRGIPTVTLTNTGATSFAASVGSIVDAATNGFREGRVANATGFGEFVSTYVASAEL